jgi:hypothetical protein
MLDQSGSKRSDGVNGGFSSGAGRKPPLREQQREGDAPSNAASASVIVLCAHDSQPLTLKLIASGEFAGNWNAGYSCKLKNLCLGCIWDPTHCDRDPGWEGAMPAPRVFLSYARSDTLWVKNFCGPDWFGANLGNLVLIDYQDTTNFGSITEWIGQKVGNAAALVAFISSNYTNSKFSQAEWDLAQAAHTNGRLVVVPVIMDRDAKIWWDKKKLGPQFGFSDADTYAYSDFSDPRTGSHAITIISENGTSDSVGRRIGDVARLLTTKISALRAAPPPPDKAAVVVLGHPTSVRQESISVEVNELATQLRSVGVAHRALRDQWTDPDQAASDEKDVFQRSAVFVQPAVPADAMLWSNVPETLTDWLRQAASSAGANAAPKNRAVLWVPARHKSEPFDKRANAGKDSDNPILRHDTAADLAGWIQQQIGAEVGPVPVVAIEALEAGRLQEALQSGCEKVVSGIVRPPPEPWSFYNKESLEDQLRLIEGERAIIAVHDLNTGLASNTREAQAAVESKVKQHKLRADEIIKELNRKLDLFWTVLLVEKTKMLPFIRYPGNKLPNVTFLPFRKMPDAKVPVAPDPDGARIYQSYLKDWVTAPN